MPGSAAFQERVALNSVRHSPHRAEIALGESLIGGRGSRPPVRALEFVQFHSTARISIATPTVLRRKPRSLGTPAYRSATYLSSPSLIRARPAIVSQQRIHSRAVADQD